MRSTMMVERSVLPRAVSRQALLASTERVKKTSMLPLEPPEAVMKSKESEIIVPVESLDQAQAR